MNETSEAQDLAQQHKEWKLRAVEILHNYGDERDLCSELDLVLEQAGLPGRPEFVETPYNNVEGVEVVGEDTAEAFETWRRETSRLFHDRAQAADLVSYQEPLVEAGFLPYDEVYRTVNAKIEGTFSVPMVVNVPVGDDLIDHLPAHQVARVVANAIRYHWNFHWKAVVDSDNDDPDKDAQR